MSDLQKPISETNKEKKDKSDNHQDSNESEDRKSLLVSFEALESTPFEPRVKSAEDEMMEEENTKRILALLLSNIKDETDRKIVEGLEDGLKVAALAKLLGKNPGAISQRLFRIRAKISELLKNIDN